LFSPKERIDYNKGKIIAGHNRLRPDRDHAWGRNLPPFCRPVISIFLFLAIWESIMSTPENRLRELNILLPVPPKPMAKYKPTVQVGNMLYVSGHGPAKMEGQKMVLGKLGAKLTLDQGKESARLVGINILATVRAALGSLDLVKRLVKTLGMVNSAPDFLDHPLVINGFSELMAEVFGEDAGVGSRSAVGMGALPGDIPVEIECIFEV
jgi:enamine deaminase RidA (YjgF/YER057c/UK114 family)